MLCLRRDEGMSENYPARPTSVRWSKIFPESPNTFSSALPTLVHNTF